MVILTINIRVMDENDYKGKYEQELKEVIKLPGVKIQIKKAGEDACSDYVDMLDNTESDYVVFYSDNVQIIKGEIQKLTDFLDTAKGDFFQQGVEVLFPNVKMAERIFLYFPSFIFRTEILRSIDLNCIPHHLYEEKILLDVTDKCGAAQYIEKCVIHTYDVLETNTSLYEPQFKKCWYQEDMEEFLLPYIQQKFPARKEVQKRVFYSVLLRFFMNLNEKEKFVIEGDELQRFFACTRKILHYMDDDVIAARKEYRKMPTSFTYLFLKEKHNVNLKMSVAHENGKERYYINDQWLESDFVDTRITAINYLNGSLMIDCEVRGDFFINDIEKDFHVLVNDRKTDFTAIEAYNIVKVLGQAVLRFYQFSFSVPRSEMGKRTAIEFMAKIKDGNIVKTPLELKKTAARLNDSRWSYYAFDDRMMVRKGNKLVIVRKKNAELFKRECAMAARAFLSIEDVKTKFLVTFLRVFYWLTKGICGKKKNWLFFDKLYKAGDNAEYLFEYCSRNAEDVNCYYIASKDSPDYRRLKKKYGRHILKFESFRQRLMVLHGDMIFATHAHVLKYCGYKGNFQKYFRHLLRARVACIQHGLTVQDIAQYQNRLRDNISFYFCASKYEIENLKRPIYGYRESELKLTGCPRYDGLISHERQQILIAPTWRRNIVISGNKIGTAKQYNPQFKNSKYFEIYNRLINDRRLQEMAETYHYKLIYLVHPTLSSQVGDFDANQNLSILSAADGISYEKILTESSLMLTDYSGVQFDFAYMKKPVLYYHPEELPPQYEETVYKYDTMGFGPVVEKYDAIIKELCDYMKNGCRMKEQYVKRVEDFFAYTDHDNCKRIYEIAKEA